MEKCRSSMRGRPGSFTRIVGAAAAAAPSGRPDLPTSGAEVVEGRALVRVPQDFVCCCQLHELPVRGYLVA
jgi:hypothetical protein